MNTQTKLAMNQTINRPDFVTDEMESYLIYCYENGGLSNGSVVATSIYLSYDFISRDQAREAVFYGQRLFNLPQTW